MTTKKQILVSVILGLAGTIVAAVIANYYYNSLMYCPPGTACIEGYPSHYDYFGWPFRLENTVIAFCTNLVFWSAVSFVVMKIIGYMKARRTPDTQQP